MRQSPRDATYTDIILTYHAMKINPRLKLAIALATVALGYAAPGAFAQSTYPDKTSEKKEYLEKKLTSQHFVRKAAIDGVKELRLAELGSASAVTPEVKGYASRLASEQQQANERLAAIAHPDFRDALLEGARGGGSSAIQTVETQ